MSKKTVQIYVSMSQKDFSILMRAAYRLWPGAEMTQPAIVLSLAKLGAKTKNPGKNKN